jgi:uncharacterized FlgJ-related protein
MKKVQNFLLKLIAAIIIFCTVYTSICVIQEDNKLDGIIKPKETIVSDTFSIQSFRTQLSLAGIKYPDLVFRQSILESGWFSSSVWVENNNPFGFWYKDSYLKFKDYKSAILYYKKWQDKHYKGGDYYEFLDGFYAEDPDYIKKLQGIKLDSIKD